LDRAKEASCPFFYEKRTENTKKGPALKSRRLLKLGRGPLAPWQKNEVVFILPLIINTWVRISSRYQILLD
jgi:hypothetical protein